jgi:hypothetical protein
MGKALLLVRRGRLGFDRLGLGRRRLGVLGSGGNLWVCRAHDVILSAGVG